MNMTDDGQMDQGYMEPVPQPWSVGVHIKHAVF